MSENNINELSIVLDGVGDWSSIFEKVMESSGETWVGCRDINEVFLKTTEPDVDLIIFVRFETINKEVQETILQLRENEHTKEAFIIAVIMDEREASQSGILLTWGYDGWIIGPKEYGGNLVAAEKCVISRRPGDDAEAGAVNANLPTGCDDGLFPEGPYGIE